MNTRLLFTFVLLLLAIGGRAQTPQYTAGTATAGNYFPLGSIDGKGSRVQLLYKPADFSALPKAGTITRIYFKADNGTESNGMASYKDLTLRMAATDLNELPGDGSTLALSLTTVFEALEYQVHFNSGQWLVFTLQQPFSYSDTANLLIELSVAQASAMRYLGFANSSGTRRVWGKTGSNHADGSDAKLYALGMDIIPAQVLVADATAAGMNDEEPATIVAYDTTIISTIATPAPAFPSLSQSSDVFNPVESKPAPARRNGGKWFVMGTALLAALGVGSLRPLLPRTRKLASWAMHHPRKAIGWSVALQLLSGLAALYTGVKLYDFGFTSSDTATTSLMALSTLAALLYPRRNSSKGDMWKGYVRQKTTGALVLASGFGLLANVGNRCAAQQDFCRPASYIITQMDSQHYERSASQTYYEPGNKYNNGWKIVATIGAVILLLAMLAVLTVLSCAVFCVIAYDATSTALIVIGVLAGSAVGAAGGFGSFKLFFYLKRLIWGK